MPVSTHPSLRRHRPRRILAAAAGAGGATALVLAAVAFAIPADTASAAPARSSATTSASCTDGSGTTWRLKATWGGAYRAKSKHGSSSKIRIVSLRWTTAHRGTIATTTNVQVTDGNGNPVATVRTRAKSDYKHGRAAKHLDPADPPADDAPATIVVTIGRSGSTPCSVTFTQPMPKPKSHGHGKPTASPGDDPSGSPTAGSDDGADPGDGAGSDDTATASSSPSESAPADDSGSSDQG